MITLHGIQSLLRHGHVPLMTVDLATYELEDHSGNIIDIWIEGGKYPEGMVLALWEEEDTHDQYIITIDTDFRGSEKWMTDIFTPNNRLAWSIYEDYGLNQRPGETIQEITDITNGNEQENG